MSWSVAVLAAGKGTRMRSQQPKVLHELAGRPVIDHVLDLALATAPTDRIVVVVGHGAQEVAGHVEARGVRTTVQEPQLGTGDAVRTAVAALPPEPDGGLMVLSGDVPLLAAASLERLRARVDGGAAAALLTATLEPPGSYGRVLRDGDGAVTAIVEARDADPTALAVREVNAGVYAFRRGPIEEALARLRPDNDQAEYYLTDVVAALRGVGLTVAGVRLDDSEEMLGINTRADLATVARILNRRVLDGLMASGVTVLDPTTTWVEPGCAVAPDAVLEPGVVLRGGTRVGAGARIGAHAVLDGVEIAAGCEIPPLTLLTPHS